MESFRDPKTDPRCAEYGCAAGRSCKSTGECANGLSCVRGVCTRVDPFAKIKSDDTDDERDAKNDRHKWEDRREDRDDRKRHRDRREDKDATASPVRYSSVLRGGRTRPRVGCLVRNEWARVTSSAGRRTPAEIV